MHVLNYLRRQHADTTAATIIRACIIAGGERTAPDMKERGNRREKKAGEFPDAD